MGNLRGLAGQTAVYGISSILARLLNYLLVPIYTRVFLPPEAGVYVEIYTYIAFLIVILTYGLETAFFRYSESSQNKKDVYSTALLSIIATTAIFTAMMALFASEISTLLRYSQNKEYIYYFSIIVALDVISTIPFAKLRAEQKAFKFAVIKVVGIFTNISLNLLLILYIPYVYNTSTNETIRPFLEMFLDLEGKPLISSIFIANIFASGITVILLSSEFFSAGISFRLKLWKSMIIYAFPLLIYGLAGIVNETIDRILLRNLLPADTAMHDLGIYGMCFKISVFMSIFIQAFRYAAEPFFFSEAKDKNAPSTYASVMNYFVMVSFTIFLVIMLYIDIVKHFVGEKYHDGLPVVPILLFGHIFLGIFYNLSIWYKLTDKTKFGAYISLMGVFITLSVNFLLIPVIGYMGSAWANFTCYFVMMTTSYYIGKKYYPVPYNLKKIFKLLILTLAIYFISVNLNITDQTIKLVINSILFFSFIFIILFTEKPLRKAIIK